MLRWGDSGLWAGAEDGSLREADAATTRWHEVRRFGGSIEAILAQGDDVYVAAEGAGIWRTSDGGGRWAQVYEPKD